MPLPGSSSPCPVSGAIHGVMQQVSESRLIAIIRMDCAETALWGAQTLLQSGIRALEITWTVPDAAAIVRQLVAEFPQACIGAGTIRSHAHIKQAQAAGAQFLVCPMLDTTLLETAQQEETLLLPGVMSPTELHQAVVAGAAAVKLFPTGLLGGAAFLKALRGPFPEVAIVPTGNITLTDVAPLLKAGAMAVGVGGDLFPERQELLQRNPQAICERVGAYLAAAACNP